MATVEFIYTSSLCMQIERMQNISEKKTSTTTSQDSEISTAQTTDTNSQSNTATRIRSQSEQIASFQHKTSDPVKKDARRNTIAAIRRIDGISSNSSAACLIQ